jgi:hypothetical protein
VIREDLPELARKSFELALANCSDCRDYHAIWGYLRVAGFRKGAGADRAIIGERLASLSSLQRVLICGSADTGQVATVAGALAGRDFTITLVDLCDTPLKLCADFATENGIRLETWRRDIREIAGLGNFDAVLLHNFIGFIPVGDRVAVLSALRGALTDQGRVLMIQRIYGQHKHDGASTPGALPHAILDALRVQKIALPESPESFTQRLSVTLNGPERENRLKAFQTVSEVHDLFREAGFQKLTTTTLEATSSQAGKGGDWRPPNERYLFEAR